VAARYALIKEVENDVKELMDFDDRIMPEDFILQLRYWYSIQRISKNSLLKSAFLKFWEFTFRRFRTSRVVLGYFYESL
jgi:hypothetical protein